MEPFVSVIVPVYKVKDFLRRCLDSLCRQSLTNIEIILIDDASPDGCGAICEEYVKKDPRFKVFYNKTNWGLSVARNIGIEKASAPYLMFVDSDDYVHEDFCRLPFECVTRFHADLVMFRYQSINDKTGKPTKDSIPVSIQSSGLKTKPEALDLLQKVVKQFAWNKLYRKELFKTISYPPGYFYEDVSTTYKTVLKASKIYYLESVLYFKCYRSSSITTLKTKKAMQDHQTMNKQRYRDLVAWCECNPDITESLLLDISLGYCVWNNPDMADPAYVFCAQTLRAYRKIPKGFTRNQKILLFAFRHCPILFNLICALYGTRGY